MRSKPNTSWGGAFTKIVSGFELPIQQPQKDRNSPETRRSFGRGVKATPVSEQKECEMVEVGGEEKACSLAKEINMSIKGDVWIDTPKTRR
jgi:hypothetical protein